MISLWPNGSMYYHKISNQSVIFIPWLMDTSIVSSLGLPWNIPLKPWCTFFLCRNIHLVLELPTHWRLQLNFLKSYTWHHKGIHRLTPPAISEGIHFSQDFLSMILTQSRWFWITAVTEVYRQNIVCVLRTLKRLRQSCSWSSLYIYMSLGHDTDATLRNSLIQIIMPWTNSLA